MSFLNCKLKVINGVFGVLRFIFIFDEDCTLSSKDNLFNFWFLTGIKEQVNTSKRNTVFQPLFKKNDFKAIKSLPLFLGSFSHNFNNWFL